jgi:hypothetical protein
VSFTVIVSVPRRLSSPARLAAARIVAGSRSVIRRFFVVVNVRRNVASVRLLRRACAR